ncbi:MAG TPA: tetratricopeptide repeat protein [Gaiellaceae bacterium]|nr:tetratricopeptide repeat protein [Gaiellaceae bacterium]
MSESFRTTHLDELAPDRGAEGARWYRLRRHLDVGAYGVNAYGADAGRRVIEEHDERGTAAAKHEELYVVLRGSARFTLDGEEVLVPAGSCVFVSDRGVRRGAIAEEDGTIVLVAGGTPGQGYRVAAWEEAADAYPHWEAGDHAKAVEILREVVEEHPNAGIVLYNLACAEVLAGEPEPALEHLRRAIELEERFREYALTDEDLVSVRDRPEFRELVGATA